ncbi:MAG: PAS domain-containing protein, partial [Actinobacteria bacterium]
MARALALADAAKEEIARLREALDALPVGMVVCDQTGREVVRSRRAVALFGDLQTDVLVARTLTELLAAARVSGRQVQTLELTGPPARSVQMTAERLASGGAVAVVEDTSERRQLDAVRRDFVANVNHELRTSIGALGVLAEALA